MLKIIPVLAAAALASAGCADTTRHAISSPPAASVPAPQTVFGQATLAGGNPAEAPAPPRIPDRALTLEECLEIAQKVSPSLDSADQAQAGALWSRWQAITAFLPAAGTEYRRTRYNDQTATNRPAPAFSGTTQYAWQTSVTQPLFTGGRNTAGYLLAQLGVAAADIRRVQAREDLLLEVKRAYFGILASEKALEVAKASVVNLKSHLNVARNFFDVGMVPKNQVLEADVELARAVQQENTLARDVMVNKARLNLLLRRAVDAPVAVVDNLKHNPFPLILEDCLRLGLADRPEMKLGRNQVEASAKGVDLARSGLYPTVGLTLANTSTGNTPRAHGGWSSDDAGWSVAALASFNFWEWGRTKAEIEKSKVELNRSVDALSGLEDETKLDVTSSYQRLISDGLNIGVSAKAVVSAAEDLRMVNERYLEQVATNTEVLDAQTRHSQAQYDYYTALYNYNLAWAALERSLGRPVPPAGSRTLGG